MVEEKVVPIVEHGPSADYPHPDTQGIDGAIGHPGEHAQPSPVVHDGQVIAAPPGHGVKRFETVPPEEEVERMLKQATGQSGHWWAKMVRRMRNKNGLGEEKVA